MSQGIFGRLWQDESGAVIATEYLMLGSILAVGSASGLASMRDGVAEEFGEFGQSVRETRQAYSPSATRGGHGARNGAAAVDARTVGTAFPAPVSPAGQNAPLPLSCP